MRLSIIVFSVLILMPFWVQAQSITVQALEINAPDQPFCGGEQGTYLVLFSGNNSSNSNAKFKKAKIKIKANGGTIFAFSFQGQIFIGSGSEISLPYFFFGEEQSNFLRVIDLFIEWDGTDGGIEIIAEASHTASEFPIYYGEYLEVNGGIEAAASITKSRQRPSCTGATFQANMPGEICPVDAFLWQIDGGPDISTNEPTLVASNVDNSQPVTISVRVRYTNGTVSSTTIEQFGPSITTPNVFGPTTICPGSDNNYNVFSSPPPTSVYWQSSTNNVVISDPYSSNIDLFVVGNSTRFTLSCTVTQCGERFVIRREIEILPAGSGGCPPIPRVGLPGEEPGEVIMEKANSGKEVGFGQEGGANELGIEGAAASVSAVGKESTFRFFPNPVRSGMELSIQSACSLGPNTQLSLMDATGKELQNIQLSESFSHSLPTQGLPPGIYILRAVNECGMEAKLLTVK